MATQLKQGGIMVDYSEIKDIRKDIKNMKESFEKRLDKLDKSIEDFQKKLYDNGLIERVNQNTSWRKSVSMVLMYLLSVALAGSGGIAFWHFVLGQ